VNTQSLYAILYRSLDWHPARITTFAELILAVVKARTIRIKELALHINSKGKRKASIVKIERFLLHQAINFIVIGVIILRLIGLDRNLVIAIDRTNWQYGKKDLNFFVAAIIFMNMSIPIVCTMLDKKGNSSANEREELIEKLLKIVPLSMIGIIVADREFVCKELVKCLENKNISYGLRAKKSELIRHVNGGKVKLEKYFSGMKQGETKVVETALYDLNIKLQITCLQLEKEQLLIASNVGIDVDVLSKYKNRWGIERTFKALKTAGFNMEDTHITDLKKLEKIFAMTSIALTLCIIAGDIKNNMIPIKVKNHGNYAYSIFTYGFDLMRDFFAKRIDEMNELATLFDLLRTRIHSCFQKSVG
jgi:hypothetical protein